MKTLTKKTNSSAVSNSPFIRSKNGSGFFNIQPKLKVGQPGDKYEIEADHVADEVVNSQPDNESFFAPAQSNSVQTKANAFIHRKPIAESISMLVQQQEVEEEEMQPKFQEGAVQQQQEEEEELQMQTSKEEEEELQMQPVEEEGKELQMQPMEEEEEVLQTKKDYPKQYTLSKTEQKLNSSKGNGSSLDTETRNQMENSFGVDFGGVKIHTDSTAVQLNRELGAHAFTHGRDIYFNRGKYNPNSKNGKHLLAHELTHTIQQTGRTQRKESTNNISSTSNTIQGGFWGRVWSGVKSAGRAVANVGSSAINAIGGALGGAWNVATTFLGNTATWALNGLKSLGTATLNWLVNAGRHVWQAIKWFGSKAWEGIKWLGSFLWEKLVLLGSNVWSFISNLPFRLWRIIVHGWEGIKGVLSWAWTGLKGGAKHIWKAVVGVFSWLKGGIAGGLRWLLGGVIGGAQWAWDFIQAPSLSKLWNALVGSISWIGDGVKGLLRWGWEGIKGIVIWAYEGVAGFVKWLWNGFVNGVAWIGTLIMHLLDFFGVGEFLQIVWGLIFRLRKLTPAEIAASRMVHPPGMIPYDLIRVDDNSLVSKIGGAAVTTMHVIHVPKSGITLSTMVHELTHVAQYEHVGSVYMPQAIHAQVKYGRSGGRGSGSAYDYEREGSLATLRAAGKKFSDFNRESQAELVQDYYNLLVSGGSVANHQPFINDMQSGNF